VIEYLWSALQSLFDFVFTKFDPWRDTIDILLVTLAIYWLLLLIRGTRAVQILLGLIVLIALSLASDFFQFAAMGLILQNFLGSAVLIIIVLFQHDIRRALARVGRGFFPSVSELEEATMVEEVVRAAQALSQRRVGALIVLERESLLSDQIDQGMTLDAQVSKELLISIFNTASPLHDGAIIIQNDIIEAAKCILPLSQVTDLDPRLGTRHRAAMGLAEESDAVIVVVSEETGKISVAKDGALIQDLDREELRSILFNAFKLSDTTQRE